MPLISDNELIKYNNLEWFAAMLGYNWLSNYCIGYILNPEGKPWDDEMDQEIIGEITDWYDLVFTDNFPYNTKLVSRIRKA
jgi:hypothetical protein